jgi:hypothetical protein
MTTHSTDQNGHNRPDRRFIKAEKWQDIPVNVLREWTIDYLSYWYTERGVAAMVGVSQSTVNDFIGGRTAPERRTLQKFGELYLKMNPQGYWEKVTVPERIVLPPLTSTLPDGERAALEYIEAVIRAAEASGTLPHSPESLREWLRFLVEAEYDVEKQFAEHKRKRRRKGSADAPPKRPRKKRPGNDPE